ncbi:G-protein coupled receptor 84 [Esox lucius]|uniref:G-protein coupled receptors family 1 profile domain-containing protein n=1 Tax=Esox lucius TaxID=8010 RepID=A0A3P8YGE3_ESOLU|nr:G-protein coupled receptor 84 [Esox lucius]
MLENFTGDAGNESFSCHNPSVEVYRYFGVLWGSAVTIVGTVGNILTILAFATDTRLRTRFNVLIVNLALADLLYCTLLQPVSVDSYLHLRWRGGALWCRVFGLLLFLSNSVSIITLCLIAFSRYLLVARRAVFERVFSLRGLFFLLPMTWALGLASFGPLWPVYVFAPQVCTCSFHRTRGRPYTTVLLFFYFFIGLGCVGLFYLLIYRRVKVAAKALVKYRFSQRSSRKKKPKSSEQGTEGDSGLGSGVASTQSCELSGQEELAQNKCGEKESPGQSSLSNLGSASISQSAQPAGGQGLPPTHIPAPHVATPAPITAPPPSTSTAASSGDSSEFRRVTRMCFTVFVCFVCCFAPFLLVNIADKQNRAPQLLHMFCANLTWLNSCINPMLYAVMNRQFGQAYRALLAKALTPLTPLTRLWTH